jgi:hypothetical protein
MSEQVRRIAKGLLCDLADHWDETRSKGEPFWSADETADILARAILAERQRCITIASHFPETMLHFFDRPGGPPGNFIRPTTGKDIAAALSQDTSSLPLTPEASTPADAASPPGASAGTNSEAQP